MNVREFSQEQQVAVAGGAKEGRLYIPTLDGWLALAIRCNLLPWQIRIFPQAIDGAQCF